MSAFKSIFFCNANFAAAISVSTCVLSALSEVKVAISPDTLASKSVTDFLTPGIVVVSIVVTLFSNSVLAVPPLLIKAVKSSTALSKLP